MTGDESAFRDAVAAAGMVPIPAAGLQRPSLIEPGKIRPAELVQEGQARGAPAPPIDADTDLRDFPYMPLDVARLRDSDHAAIATGDEFMASVLLWCAAWHQTPAGSLPDDDRVLAQLAGYGRYLAGWHIVRVAALRGWIRHSDARLYHPVITEKVRGSWAAKLKNQYQRFVDRARKENQGLKAATFDEWMAAGRPSAIHGPESGIPAAAGISAAEFQRKHSLNIREVKGERTTKTPGKSAGKRPIPVDFAISDRVRSWAAEKGLDRLDEHFEKFVGTCKAKDYRYVDWDEALMNAIRDNWAKLERTLARHKPSTEAAM
jgi:Protein of unknown function (DUF1376)